MFFVGLLAVRQVATGTSMAAHLLRIAEDDQLCYMTDWTTKITRGGSLKDLDFSKLEHIFQLG